MAFIEIFLLSLALAADAFTVGAAVGLRHRRPAQIFRLSFSFGFFQSLMSFGGILAGTALVSVIEQWDHWLAFALLATIGARMIYNSLKNTAVEEKGDSTAGLMLIGLSVAVSIDALAAGVGLGTERVPIAMAVTTIGVVASAATLAAMLLAGRIQKSVGSRCGLAAGVVLIAIGAKILFEHLSA